jgi:[lysine-biosynthesis-protein LysW]---L-2-aminoadipate ligase
VNRSLRETSRPHVLLTVTVVRQEEKQLAAALRERGCAVTVAKMADLAGVLNGTGTRPDIALVRNLAHHEAVEATRRLAAYGVPTVNSPDAVELCGDKGQQALLFGRLEIPHPTSYLAYDLAQVAELVGELGSAVIKPVSASWGRGLARITDAATLECWSAGRESVDAAGKHFPVLVQEYIAKPGYDLRVVVVGDEPVVSIQRVSADWRTNTHLGATIRRTELTVPVRRLVSAVLDHLGPGFYGVDVVVEAGTGRHFVLEVNANPEFARSAPVHGVDIAGLLADHVLDRCRPVPYPLPTAA